MTSQTPVDLLNEALRTHGEQPFVTHYDDGARVELSFATFHNWVAKTANLLVDGLGAGPGDRVALALPTHWQTAAWLVACWSAGLVAVPVPAEEIPPAQVVAADAARLAAATASGADDVVGLSLHPLGAPLADCPPAVLDYATEVRGHGDRFAPPAKLDPDAPALHFPAEDAPHSAGQLAELGHGRADEWGLSAAERIYCTVDYTDLSGIVAGLLAPLAAGAAIVTGTNTDRYTLNTRLTTERVTAIADGVSGTTTIRKRRVI